MREFRSRPDISRFITEGDKPPRLPGEIFIHKVQTIDPLVPSHINEIVEAVAEADKAARAIRLSADITRKLRIFGAISGQTAEEVAEAELDAALSQLLSKSGLAQDILEDRVYPPGITFRREHYNDILDGLAEEFPESIDLD